MNGLLLDRRRMMMAQCYPFTPATMSYILNNYGQAGWATVRTFFQDPATASLVDTVNLHPTIVEPLCGLNGGMNMYLSNVNGAYILTDYAITADDELDLEFQYNASVKSAQYIFGACNAWADGATLIATASNAYSMYFYFGNSTTSPSPISISGDAKYRFVANKDNIDIYTNGIKASYSINADDFTTQPMVLFMGARKNTPSFINSNSYLKNGSIRKVAIKRGGLYRLYYLPWSVSGVDCFIDVVTGNFVYNNDGKTGSYLQKITIN